ncbi:hypothetical protein ZWY2020_021887 [Hordeum vulgare]|nr:hypothetical protein ZWY2020_021887 [Hordeum vulgare]
MLMALPKPCGWEGSPAPSGSNPFPYGGGWEDGVRRKRSEGLASPDSPLAFPDDDKHDEATVEEDKAKASVRDKVSHRDARSAGRPPASLRQFVPLRFGFVEMERVTSTPDCILRESVVAVDFANQKLAVCLPACRKNKVLSNVYNVPGSTLAIVVDLRGSSTRKRGSNTRKQSRAAASVVHVDLLGAATKEPAISRNDASEGLDAVEDFPKSRIPESEAESQTKAIYVWSLALFCLLYQYTSSAFPYEVNQGSWYDMQPSKHRLYTDKFLATMAPPTTWRRRLHRQPAFPQFVQSLDDVRLNLEFLKYL